jgi:hypothetical protein
MNHYLGLDPYVIRERNEEIRREVRALRLEGRMRQDQRQTPSRLVVFALRSTLPLLRSVGLAER